MNDNYDENDIADLDDLMNYYRIDDNDLIRLDGDEECYKFEEDIITHGDEY